jgi:hypothetical protein
VLKDLGIPQRGFEPADGCRHASPTRSIRRNIGTEPCAWRGLRTLVRQHHLRPRYPALRRGVTEGRHGAPLISALTVVPRRRNLGRLVRPTTIRCRGQRHNHLSCFVTPEEPTAPSTSNHLRHGTDVTNHSLRRSAYRVNDPTRDGRNVALILYARQAAVHARRWRLAAVDPLDTLPKHHPHLPQLKATGHQVCLRKRCASRTPRGWRIRLTRERPARLASRSACLRCWPASASARQTGPVANVQPARVKRRYRPRHLIVNQAARPQHRHAALRRRRQIRHRPRPNIVDVGRPLGMLHHPTTGCRGGRGAACRASTNTWSRARNIATVARHVVRNIDDPSTNASATHSPMLGHVDGVRGPQRQG